MGQAIGDLQARLEEMCGMWGEAHMVRSVANELVEPSGGGKAFAAASSAAPLASPLDLEHLHQ